MAAAKGGIQRGGNRGGGRGPDGGGSRDGQRSHAESNPGYVRTAATEITVRVEFTKPDGSVGVRLVQCCNTDCESPLAVRDWYRTAGVK